MADLRVDEAAVRAQARKILDGADHIDGINWPTMDSGSMTGSAVARSAAATLLQDRVADLVAHMRDWAAATLAAATSLDGAQMRHARQLDEGR